jgi:hypothetical protein
MHIYNKIGIWTFPLRNLVLMQENLIITLGRAAGIAIAVILALVIGGVPAAAAPSVIVASQNKRYVEGFFTKHCVIEVQSKFVILHLSCRFIYGWFRSEVNS